MHHTSPRLSLKIGLALCVLATPFPLLPAAEPGPASPDVQETTVYQLPDRLLKVQRVTEQTLPILPPPPAPVAALAHPPTPEWLARRAARQASRWLSLGGTVYLAATGPARSRVTYHVSGSTPVVFWSSIDWNLLAGSSRFVTPDGTTYNLLQMFSSEDLAKTSARYAKRGLTYIPPVIPAFPADAASYQIVSGAPTPAMLADLDALHAYHDREHAALLAAAQQRIAARLAAAAAAKLPQPPPPDILIQHRPMTREELQSRRPASAPTSSPQS